jgi:REP element-mobilizing transposase RayT
MHDNKPLNGVETDSQVVKTAQQLDPSDHLQSEVSSSGTGFQPVNPWKSAELIVQRRNLPHLQALEATYFVTFRCRKDILLPQAARQIVLSAIRYWDGKRIDLDGAVVMLDHAHAMFRILDVSTLSEILHSIKSFSSNQINRLLGRKGQLWLDESFDHVIRHELEWDEKLEYIRQNPIKNNLAETPEEYPWLYIKTYRLEASATCGTSRKP